MKRITTIFAILVFIVLMVTPIVTNAQGAYIMRIQYDASQNPIYVGQANPGTAETTASWQIKKITYDANNNPTDVSYANGSEGFSFKWSLRTTYTYS